MDVKPIPKSLAASVVIKNHYMHRRPPMSYAFGLFDEHEKIVGVITLGVPASRHMMIGACPSEPDAVLELNRLWVHDDCPKNTESWFVSKALSLMPPRIILSYADTAVGHMGYVYRASNWHYAGWTDMERKTARFDYLVPGKHTRDAFRRGGGTKAEKVRRKPKVRYWITTGDRRERKKLDSICAWPRMCWKAFPPPTEHLQLLGFALTN